MTRLPGRRIAATTSCTPANDAGGRQGREGDRTLKLRHRTILAGLALFATAHAAHAALFDEEARQRIEATNQRLSLLQRQVEDRLAQLELQAKSGAVADLATQIQLLQG